MAKDKKDKEEPIERSKLTLIGFDTEDVRYEAVKHLAELLDISFDEATDLADAAPVDILPSAPTEAAEALGERLNEAGCITAALPLGPVYRYCETHPHRRARKKCKTCGINICDRCLAAAKSHPYCPEHYEIFRQKQTLRWVGGAFIAVALLFVTLFFSGPIIRNYRLYTSPKNVHIATLFVSQKPDATTNKQFFRHIRNDSPDQYKPGDQHAIADIATWLNKEYRRVTQKDLSPFSFEGSGFYKIAVGPPPPAPEGDKSYKGLQMDRDYKAYFTQLLADNAIRIKFDVLLVVDIEPTTGVGRDFMEDIGSASKGYAYIRIPAESTQWPGDYYVAAAAHYVLRALGATLKINSKGYPKNPEGLASPRQEPPFAQPQAEITACYRAVEEFSIDRPSSLDDYMVGPLTAFEIGWISKSLASSFYPTDVFR